MKFRRYAIISFIGFAFVAIALAVWKRPRESVTQNAMRQAIRETPIQSPYQRELLKRARHSHVIDVAYDEYTEKWRRDQNGFDANLLRGVAAEYLGVDGMRPKLSARYEWIYRTDLFQTAGACLEKAVQINPQSSVANMEYGFFLWQFGYKMPEGIALLQKAAGQAPSDPHVHELLGNVYANPSVDSYDPKKAIHELNLAILLDPEDSFSREILANLYHRLDKTPHGVIKRR
ncbi:MAG: hypothetical protein ABIY70_14825 [Capsulimonas sp.]|uniref:tetratricopeptide repeat protein n=1 Tax=Capsulimonas sp. TaxID=2494211 RepID=UPI0032633420